MWNVWAGGGLLLSGSIPWHMAATWTLHLGSRRCEKVLSPSQPDLQSASAVQFMILPVGAKSFQEAMKMGTEVNVNV